MVGLLATSQQRRLSHDGPNSRLRGEPAAHSAAHRPAVPPATLLDESSCSLCPVPSWQAVFKPEIAQIWIDNLADLYGNLNLLAADLFAT